MTLAQAKDVIAQQAQTIEALKLVLGGALARERAATWMAQDYENIIITVGEIVGSARQLQEATGQTVQGFRAIGQAVAMICDLADRIRERKN